MITLKKIDIYKTLKVRIWYSFHKEKIHIYKKVRGQFCSAYRYNFDIRPLQSRVKETGGQRALAFLAPASPVDFNFS